MNILFGAMGVIFAFKGRLDTAFLLMLAAAACDFCDGLSARLLGAYSEMGKELDSLCDVVSFGLLPSMMLYNLMAASHGWTDLLCFIPLVIVIFSALRLAKFNLDERQTHSFIGLPTPACALLCGALCHMATVAPDSFIASWAAGDVFIPLLSVALSALLVSEVPMFSMKFGGGHSASSRDNLKRFICLGLVACAVLLCIFASLPWSAAVLCGFSAYILENLVFALIPEGR